MAPLKLQPAWLSVLCALCLALGAAGSQHPVFAADGDYYQMDDNAILHFHRAQGWLLIGQISAAIQEYQIAIRLKPSTTMTAALYNDLGLAYIKAREFPKSIVSFQQALSLNPNFSLYYDNLGKAYQMSGGVQSAMQQLHQTTLLNPDDVQAWYLLGVLYKAAGDESASRDAFQTFVKLAPNSELADAAKLHLESFQNGQTTVK